MSRAEIASSMVASAVKSAPKRTQHKIQKSVSNGAATPKKEQTGVRYEALDDGKYADLETESGQKVRDGSSPTRYYDAVDRCNKCMSRYPCGGCACKLPVRYSTALMACLGFLISFGIRTNMGISILKMTKITENTTITLDNGTIYNQSTKVYDWDGKVQGLMDSSFFWGYIVTQVPGGYLSSILPANRVFGGAIAASAFLNLFLPSACKVHYIAGMAVRVVQGLIEGVTYPACHGIWRYWAPPLERSRLATIAFSGSYAGAVIGLPVSSLLTDYLGWEACFYTYGAVGITWGIVWWFMSFERPSTHPRISREEREYIEDSLGLADNTAIKFAQTPWKSIVKSLPVYAIIVANFCRSWTFYLLLVNQTKYLLDVFDYKMATAGLLGILPHLVMATVVPIGGLLADMLRSKGILSTTNVRKIFNCGGFGLEATFLLVVAFSKHSTAALAALTIAVGFSGFAITGYNVNHLDIAPRYASILMGLSNGVGTLSGIFCPILTSKLTEDVPDKISGWRNVFIIAGCIHYMGIIFYGIFASGEKQPWANPPELQKEEARDNLSRYGSVHGLTGSKYSLNSTNAPCNYNEIQTRAEMAPDGELVSDVDDVEESTTPTSSDAETSSSSSTGQRYAVRETTSPPVRPAPRIAR